MQPGADPSPLLSGAAATGRQLNLNPRASAVGPVPVLAAAQRAIARGWRLVAVLVCGLCATSAGQAAELVLAVPRIAHALPVFVADEQGFFAAAGLKVKVQECPTGQRCMEQLFAGTAQLAGASELPVMFNSFERADFAIFATMSSATRNMRLVARRSAGIGTPAQLAGKRIGVIPRSGVQYYLDAYLLFQGIDPKLLQMVPMEPQELGPALLARRIDAFAGYALHAVPTLQALGADGLALDGDHVYTESFHLVASRETLLQRRGELVQLLGALARAQQFIAERPREARRILQVHTRLEPAVAEAVFPLFTYRLGLDQSVVGTLEGQARWALREGHAPRDRKIPNYLQFVDAGPLRAAVPQALPR